MGMLVIISMMAIGALIMNIKAIQSNPYIGIRSLSTFLFGLSSLRYITLILFAKDPSVELMASMEGFYYISMISLPVLLILVMWYITPLYREKVGRLGLTLICSPHIMLYIAMLTLKPFEAIKSQSAGYTLRQTGQWGSYLAMFYSVFILLYIISALYGFKLYKHGQTRGQYLVLIMCQVLFLMDGLSYLRGAGGIIPIFTLTEVFGFLGIYIGFSKPTIDYRAKRLSTRE